MTRPIYSERPMSSLILKDQLYLHLTKHKVNTCISKVYFDLKIFLSPLKLKYYLHMNAICQQPAVHQCIIFSKKFGVLKKKSSSVYLSFISISTGIGVDDMFVIVESYKRLTPKQQELPVEERIALTLRHAGVSITVTSITDIVAFGIGASTVGRND